jgi:hypothetical protein
LPVTPFQDLINHWLIMLTEGFWRALGVPQGHYLASDLFLIIFHKGI